MPGYDWRDDSGNVDASQSGYDYSSGTSYGNSNDNSSNNYDYNYTDDNYYEASGAGNENNNSVDTSAWEDAYNSMSDSGQIGGGMGGGVYDKGPVVYPKEFYTPEGWNEVQKYGWSSKLLPQFQYDGQYSITNPGMDQYGQFQTLPEGVLYSSNLNNGQGGYIKTNNFMYPGGGGGGYGYGYGYGRGRSGGISGRAAQPTIDPYNPEFGKWGQSTVQGDFIRSLKNRGGIISIVR